MADSARGGRQAEGRPRFPQRPQRHISTTRTTTAYPNGEINVKNFLRSHENEIKSLESAITAAKKGLMRRAFQDVPRELRRRTASHNPQRVPKRLRSRARQEAKEDNTPISRGTSGSGIGKGKKKWLRKEGTEKSRARWEARANRRKEKSRSEATTEMSKQNLNNNSKQKKSPVLASPPTPSSRFLRRQRDKTWLPTHIWHTKRSRMTNPKEPLWRFAIPLAPAVKSYRLTHRATTQRGAVAWDMSYMATIGLEGLEAGLIGVLKGLHFSVEGPEDPWQQRGVAQKWVRGTRAWEGWIYKREGKLPEKIALTTIIWSAQGADESGKRKIFIRIHPSAFFQLWAELVKVARVQKPAVKVEDLRFQIGSIEIVGPAAAETLCSVLYPSPISEQPPDAAHTIWPALAQVTDPSLLPRNALLAFSICDPRLRDPPATSKLPQDPFSQEKLHELLAHWPIDRTLLSPELFSSSTRLVAERSLQSQKSINRRKSICTLGEYPEPRSTDPQIPAIVFVSRTNKSWSVLLPWNCVLPVWRAIMRYPVSTGANPRFGGLKERRQIDFERSNPSFPYDFPGTDAGRAWELQERITRKYEWTKRPKGKRIEWSTIDLGNGRKGEVGDPWACEWDCLLVQAEDSSPTATKAGDGVVPLFRQVPKNHATEITTGGRLYPEYMASPHLFAVKISMVQRGIPTTCARVYRLPTHDAELRSKWLSLVPTSSSNPKKGSRKQNSHFGDKARKQPQTELARNLLTSFSVNSEPPKAGEADYPVVPDEGDLIGFVTTGNYNLGEGIPTGVANLAVHRIWEDRYVNHGMTKEDRLCIVREAGRTIGRLAMWEII